MHIDSWPEDSQYPNGHFVRSIGPIGEIETETAVILLEHQLAAEPFSKAVLTGNIYQSKHTWMHRTALTSEAILSSHCQYTPPN